VRIGGHDNPQVPSIRPGKKEVSGLARIAVARLRIDEVVIVEVVERVEGGPLVRLLVPALEHHGVVGVRAQALRLRHPVQVLLHLVDHLRVRHARIGVGAQRHQLVEQNTCQR